MAYPRKWDARVDWDIQEMFHLRKKGMTYAALGRRYHKDHTTIRHHCVNNSIFPAGTKEPALPEIKIDLNRIDYLGDERIESVTSFAKKQLHPTIKYEVRMNDHRHEEKGYDRYLRESLLRPAESFYKEKCGLLKDVTARSLLEVSKAVH